MLELTILAERGPFAKLAHNDLYWFRWFGIADPGRVKAA